MNREIVEYIVLSDVRIERKVMEYIKNGRQPFGSPFMSGKELEMYTRQAMVKYAPLPVPQTKIAKNSVSINGKEGYHCPTCEVTYPSGTAHFCPGKRYPLGPGQFGNPIMC